MVKTKDNPMVYGSILDHEIIEELGEVPRQTAGGLAKSPTIPTTVGRVVATLRIPTLFVGT